MSIIKGDNVTIHNPTTQKGMWFHERKKQLPRSPYVSIGNEFVLMNAAPKDGGFYYLFVKNKNYSGVVYCTQVRIFGNIC